MRHSGSSVREPRKGVETLSKTGKFDAEWLDLRALTGYACTSERTIREWIHRPSDALPAYQIAKKIFVKRAEFDDWLRRHSVVVRDKAEIEEIVNDVIRDVTRTR